MDGSEEGDNEGEWGSEGGESSGSEGSGVGGEWKCLGVEFGGWEVERRGLVCG